MSTFDPAAHTACSLQKVLPAKAWNWPSAHESHEAAFRLPENFPAGQSSHRSSRLLLLSLSHVPGVHWTLVLQNGWLVLSWYLPEGQTVDYCSLLIAVYLSAGQGSQAVELMNWPGMQSAQ